LYLKDDEKAMLDGREGRAVQLAMELLVRYGEALGAEKMVDTKNVGGTLFIPTRGGDAKTADFHAIQSMFNLDSPEPVKLPKVKVPSMQFQTHMDPDSCDILNISDGDRDYYRANEAFVRSLGVQMACSCTPYQVGNVPVKGEHCAWMESSAVVYINSVLGARTNCEGNASTLSAMLTGKIPYWGYHCPEYRRGTHLIKVETPVETFEDWGLLGYYAGLAIQDKVPVISGITAIPSKDMLKQFGAAAASSGGLEMYHITGITPEAPDVETAFGGNRPVETMKFGWEEKKRIYERINCTAESNNIDLVMLGCPHYSLEQMWNLSNLLDGKKIKSSVAFWIFVPKAIKVASEESGYSKIIEQAGAKIMAYACPAMGHLIPKGAKVMCTDSGKQAHYLPNMTGIQAWYGSTEECVNAAVSGVWEGKLK
jgi:predicted aconitase